MLGREEKEAFPRHVRVLKHRLETNRNGDQSGNEISNDAFPHHVRVLKHRLGWEMAINRRIDFRIRFHSYFVPSRGNEELINVYCAPRSPEKLVGFMRNVSALYYTLPCSKFSTAACNFPLALLKEIVLPIGNVLTSKYWITSRCLPFRCRMIAVSLSLSSNKENNVSILWKYCRSVLLWNCCRFVLFSLTMILRIMHVLTLRDCEFLFYNRLFIKLRGLIYHVTY